MEIKVTNLAEVMTKIESSNTLSQLEIIHTALIKKSIELNTKIDELDQRINDFYDLGTFDPKVIQNLENRIEKNVNFVEELTGLINRLKINSNSKYNHSFNYLVDCNPDDFEDIWEDYDDEEGNKIVMV